MNLVSNALLKPYEERFLRHRDPAIQQRSKEIIDKYLLSHVREIRRAADTHQWPLDFMNIVVVGGTARLLSRELYEVFGDQTFIPENPEFVNASGFLKKMCADQDIDLTALRKKIKTKAA